MWIFIAKANVGLRSIITKILIELHFATYTKHYGTYLLYIYIDIAFAVFILFYSHGYHAVA